MPSAVRQWEGQVIESEFRLLEYLGSSDRSVVYRAESPRLESQKLAIKFFFAGHADAETQLARWRFIANLSHPHLIRIFHSGQCQLDSENLLYVVMECAEEDLSQILPSRPLTPGEARDMLLPALSALSYLHTSGLTHSRLKPSNIMAVGDQLKISSDSICATGEHSAVSARPSPADPPEIATEGSSPAGDVWSLGMTLVETLTQRVAPFDQSTSDPAISNSLPEPFLDIARHCLRRDPRLRWTVAEIDARLQPPPVAAPQATRIAPSRNVRPEPRYPLPLVLIGASLLAILIGYKLFHHHPAAPAPEPSVNSASGQPSSASASHPSSAHTSSGAKHGGSLSQGAVVHQVLPDVPTKARSSIRGTVKVRIRVQVDGSGNVAGANIDSAGPSKYFANLALNAARQWKFSPAKSAGQSATTAWIVRFEFTQTDTKASAARAQ